MFIFRILKGDRGGQVFLGLLLRQLVLLLDLALGFLLRAVGIHGQRGGESKSGQGRDRHDGEMLLASLLLALPAGAADRDRDGLDDGFERRYGVTDPGVRDSDHDGVIDSAEDNDKDGLGNLGEFVLVEGVGAIADVAVVWARTEDGIRGFLVERGTEGFETSEHEGKYSLRVSVTSQLAFSDCRIPADNILPGTTGLKNALMCLNQARYGISWGVIGAALVGPAQGAKGPQAG